MARKQQSWDFERLHPDAELSSFPDKEKASNVGEFTHSGSLGAGSEDAGVGVVPKDSSHCQCAWSSGKGSWSSLLE